MHLIYYYCYIFRYIIESLYLTELYLTINAQGYCVSGPNRILYNSVNPLGLGSLGRYPLELALVEDSWGISYTGFRLANISKNQKLVEISL